MTLTGALDGAAGNMEAVFANFGLRPQDGDAAMAAGDPVGAMMAAIQARAERERAAAPGAGAAPSGAGAPADGSAGASGSTGPGTGGSGGSGTDALGEK